MLENITTRTKTFYDLMEMCELVDKTLGYPQRNAGKHFHPDTTSFKEWCDSKNYGDTDPDGKIRISSRMWFAEYNKEVHEGEIKEGPYLDFWLWQCQHAFNEKLSNDSYNAVYVGMNLDKDTPYWVREIQQVWHDLFISIANEDEYVDIWVCW